MDVLWNGGIGMQRFRPKTTLKARYKSRCFRPLEFWGCWDGARKRLKEDLLKCDVNGLFTNFSWLFQLLAPDDTRDIGAKVHLDSKLLEVIDGYLANAEKLGLKVFNGNITCNNFHVYPDWFTSIHPDIYMVDQNGNKVLLQHEHDIPQEKQRWWTSIEHPALNRLKREFTEIMARTFTSSEAICIWKIDGESLYPPNAKPGAVGDYAPLAKEHFSAWLKEKYRTIDALNAAWSGRYSEFNEIIPPDPFQFTYPALEWHTFRINAMTEYVQNQYMMYKSVDADRFAFSCVHDVGLRNDELLRMGLSQADYPYVGDGVDVDIIIRPGEEDYNIRYFEVMTSFGKPISSGEYSYYPRPWPAKALRRQIYELLGLGVWSVGLIQWEGSSDCLINWGIKDTEAEKETKKLFSELRTLSPDLDMMWPDEPAVRIFISNPTRIMRGWKKEWIDLHRVLLDMHIGKRYIFDRQILDGSVMPQVIISLSNDIIDNTVCKRLEEYVRDGGILVIIGETGTFDQKLQSREQHILNEYFTLSRHEEENASFNRGFYKYIHGEGMVLTTTECDVRMATHNLALILEENRVITGACKIACIPDLPGGEAESFTLSDGVNLAVVIINTSESEAAVSLVPEGLYPSTSYKVKELISQTDVCMAASVQADDTRFKIEVKLKGGEAKVIYFERIAAENEVSEEIISLFQRLEKLSSEGFDISESESFLKSGITYLKKCRYDKALACVDKVKKTLFIRTGQKQRLGAGVTRIRIGLADIYGQPMKNAGLDAWLTPLYDTRLKWSEIANGEYEIKIDRSKLPRVYDYDRKEYTDYDGKLKINIDAYTKEHEGWVSVCER
jgi:hypothetical protein